MSALPWLLAAVALMLSVALLIERSSADPGYDEEGYPIDWRHA